jgi:Leucine-rich repeat (LRR) protein
VWDCFSLWNFASHEPNDVFVLKVLQKLPEGLAISVLAASEARLETKLSMLSESLHPLAVEAAFPSIRRNHSLTLSLDAVGTPANACAVLKAATTATTALQKLDLWNIPVCDNDHLLQLISAACRSALGVCLHFADTDRYQIPQSQHYAELEDTLSQNTALTSLELTFPDVHNSVFKYDKLLESLTSLQTLKLAPKGYRLSAFPRSRHLPPAMHFIRMSFLTHLDLGHGFHLEKLSEIIPYMTRLQALTLRGSSLLELPPLSHLTALQSLEVHDSQHLQYLPSLDTLTALQTLCFAHCAELEEWPSLATLTALQDLYIGGCRNFGELPSLCTLTALQTLIVVGSHNLEELPPLATLTGLHTLILSGCRMLQQLPSLEHLTALETLDLSECHQSWQLPPLDGLLSLQTLELAECVYLQQVPPLDTLTALQTLDVSGCFDLRQLPPLPSVETLQVIGWGEDHHLQFQDCSTTSSSLYGGMDGQGVIGVSDDDYASFM